MKLNRKKDTLWNFRASDDFIERLLRAANVTDVPAAQIVREAVKEKLDRLAVEFPQIDEAPKTPEVAASGG